MIQGWQASPSAGDEGKADPIKGMGTFPLAVLASRKGRVLDAGCGRGGTSLLWLAKEFSRVYALDSKLDGLRSIYMRAAQEGVENISPVQGTPLVLPFPDDCFDLVLLDGVGALSSDYPAKAIREMALREMARVLHPEGILHVAIENRFGLQYFMDYRILTKLLRTCGFSYSKRFAVFPSHQNCKYAASLEGTSAVAFLFGNILFSGSSWPAKLARAGSRIVSRIPVFLKTVRFFSPSWIIFASRECSPDLALQSEERPLTIENNQDTRSAITVTARRVGIFLVDEISGRLNGKYTIPVNELAERKIDMTHLTTELIRRVHPSLKESVAEASKHRTGHGSVEFTKGVSGAPLDTRDPKDLASLVDLLVSLDEISLHGADELARIPIPFDVRGLLYELAVTHGLSDKIRDLSRKAQIIHGDLESTNILIDAGTPPHQPVLIDFEHAKVGPAVLNWYDFLLRNYVIYGGRYPLNTRTILKRCRRLPGNTEASAMLNGLTARFLEACGVPLALHGELTALYMAYLCQDPVVADPESVISYLKSIDFHVDGFRSHP